MLPAPFAMAAPSTAAHRWRFYRAGGVDQVRLDRGSDILHLERLDQRLWVALSCPTKGLEFDERTLAMLDTDGDGHVRPPELIAATRWLGLVLKDADALVAETDGVALANLRTDTPEGKALLASAQRLLKGLKKADATLVTVDDAMRFASMFATAEHNGDGIVPPDTIEDAASRQVATEIVDCLGGAADRSGRPGIDRARIDAFFADCAAYAEWWKTGETGGVALRPFGADTAAASQALEAVRAKVDDFFGRCRLAAFDPRALSALNREETAYLEVAAKDLSITASEVAHFPLAMIAADKALPLDEGLNPAWASRIAAFRDACCKGRSSLTEVEWIALCAKLAAYRTWTAARTGGTVEKLGIERVRAILGGGAKAKLCAATDADAAVAGEIDGIAQVEKLARLHRDLHKLLNNYVAFTDFYARRGAIFQAGTLHFDGRTCDLTFHVTDAGKHGSLAAMAKTYLAYVDCARPGGARMTVACAFTAGDSDNLFAGRNGIFYDRKGRDWNATVTKIIDNPISIGQAFWSPYKKLMRWIEEQVAKRAAAADSASTEKLTAAAGTVGDAAATGRAVAPPKKFDPSVVALFSVAISGITGVVGTVIAVFAGMGPWVPIGLLGVLLAVSGPSMVIAWIKLRQRNLGPILDANGWAVNALAKVNIPLGGSLTELRKLPKGAERSLVDPYAPKKSLWPRLVLVLLLLAGVTYGLYRFNFLHRWFPDFVSEYRAPGFDGPTTGIAGGAPVLVKLGSGAAKVTLIKPDGSSASLDVIAGVITVPMTDAAADTMLTLVDTSGDTSERHDIAVKKQP